MPLPTVVKTCPSSLVQMIWLDCVTAGPLVPLATENVTTPLFAVALTSGPHSVPPVTEATSLLAICRCERRTDRHGLTCDIRLSYDGYIGGAHDGLDEQACLAQICGRELLRCRAKRAEESRMERKN